MATHKRGTASTCLSWIHPQKCGIIQTSAMLASAECKPSKTADPAGRALEGWKRPGAAVAVISSFFSTRVVNQGIRVEPTFVCRRRNYCEFTTVHRRAVPTSWSELPMIFFKAMCSAISSANTSSLVWIFLYAITPKVGSLIGNRRGKSSCQTRKPLA